MRAALSLAAVIVVACAGPACAAVISPIHFDYPSFEGDFYVSGTVYMPPGAVATDRNIRVETSGGLERATFIKGTEKWGDGSLMSVEIMFAANSARRTEYFLHYGEDITRWRILTKTAVLPTVSFSMVGLPKTSEKMNVDVGEINVTVDRSPQIYYYAYAVPLIAILLVTFFRSRRAGWRRSGEAE